MDIRLIGKKWKSNSGDMIDGFRVISMELELAVWENNEKLFDYLSSILWGELPLPGARINEVELDIIINTLTNDPVQVYGETWMEYKIVKDIMLFTKAKDWLKKSYPHGWIEFDI